MRDFMMEKYGGLCHALLKAGYTTKTVQQYLAGATDSKTVVLRHDVDRRPDNALQMAKLEHALGIASTYYFRHPYTFIPEIIGQILPLGHEVGYHYEVLSKAKGDYKKAIALFREELEDFRTLCDVRTICMHGCPLSPHDNRELWKIHNFQDYGIEGEAYLSMAGKNILYLTDTGRSWCGKHSVRDVMPGAEGALPSVKKTNDLIHFIESPGDMSLCLSVHPERWAPDWRGWATGYMKDLVMNAGKRVIVVMR